MLENKSTPSSKSNVSKPLIRLIVGLGNPGPSYHDTRHNAGEWFVEDLCKRFRIALKSETKFSARFAESAIQSQTVKIAISNTYMNHSGRAVGSIAKYFQIPAEQILVVHDELDLPPGVARFKTGGGHGGHNGLKDIIHHLHTREFHRLRIGIGHPGQKDDVVDYVLHRPSLDEEKKIRTAIDDALDVVPMLVAGEFEKAMSKLHEKRPPNTVE